MQRHAQRGHKEDHRQNQVAVQIRALHEHKTEQVDPERRRGVLHHPPAHPSAFILRVQPRISAPRRNRAEQQHRRDHQVCRALRREQRHAAPPADELEEVREDRPERLPHRRAVERVEDEGARPAHAAGKQTRIDDFRHSIAQRAHRESRQRHGQEPRVRVAARALSSGKQPVKPRHRHHRAEEAEHIAHRAEPLDQTEQRKRGLVPLSLPPRRPEPERHAPKAEDQVNDVITADGHVARVDGARRQREHRGHAERCAQRQPARAAQPRARRHAQHEDERVADDPHRLVAGRQQKRQRVKQVHVDAVDLRGIQPIHLNQAVRPRLPVRQNDLRGHVAVQIDQIPGLLQPNGEDQRQYTEHPPRIIFFID